ncbi:MAG: helix-turn-helix transcriptional regulator [Saprospiraceae bacterium]
MNNIAGRIKKLRISKGMNQDDIASRLNISQSAYTKIENGITKLDIERITELSKILEVDISELLSNEENRTNNYNNSKLTNSPGFVENYHVGIKEAYEQTIKSLKEEISFLRSMLSKKN